MQRLSNLRDFQRWMKYLVNESKLWFIKALLLDSFTTSRDKTKATFILIHKCVKFTPVKIINRCIITGRAKSVIWDFWLSRMELKDFASKGVLPGVQKRGF